MFILAAALVVAIMLVASAALTVTVTATALTVTVTTAAALMILFIVVMIALLIIAGITITTAVTTAGAGAHLLTHDLRHFLIRGSRAFLNSNDHVLIYHGEHFIQLLASLKEAFAKRIIHHVLAQFIKLSNLTFRRGHTLHVFVAQSFTIFTYLAEQVGCGRILVKKAYTGLSGNDFLRLGEGRSQLHGQLCHFRRKRCICHIGGYITRKQACPQ